MGKSSCFSVWTERLAPLQHGPQDIDAAACEGDERLGVVFSLLTLAVVEGFGQRVLLSHGAERALVENPLGRLVTTIGSPPSRTFP